MLKAGDLNSRIEIQEKAGIRNSVGQLEQQWVSKQRLWANVKSLSGLELLRSDIEVSQVNLSIVIRKNREITAGMRVKHDDFIYEIIAVQHDAIRNEKTTLICKGIENENIHST